MADLRKTFRWLQERYGFDVLLQRKDLSSPKEGQYRYQPNKGYRNELEKYTVRSSYPRQSRLTTSREEVTEGVVTYVDLLFYFQWDANPKEGDRIYVEDDRFKIQESKEYFGMEVYKVDYALANIGVGGRIEYWTVGATREEPH